MSTSSTTGVTTATAGAEHATIAPAQSYDPNENPQVRPEEVSALHQPDPNEPVSFLESALIEFNRRGQMPFKDQPTMREQCLAVSFKYLLNYLMAKEGVKSETDLEQQYHKRIEDRRKRSADVAAKQRHQDEERTVKARHQQEEENKRTANHTTHKRAA